MKKIFTLIAAALMSMGASAQLVQVNINESGASKIPAETVLADNECFTATTVFETTACGVKDDGTTPSGEYFYEHANLTFPAWIDIRVNDEPSAENPNGTANKTSVIIVAKKNATLSAYVRTGNTKEVKLFDQSTFTALASTSAYTADGTSNNRWTWTWNIEAGKTYVLTEKGGTGRLSGFTYELIGGGSTGDDNAPANAAGLYRTVLDTDYYSVHNVATTLGVTVETIMGATTKDVDLDNDENYGDSSEQARFHGSPVELEEGLGRIFPITELTARDDNSFYGFKMTIPAGKAVNIDRLVGQAFCGNAYSWAITISQNGNVLYDTKNLKCNGYNQAYCYMDSVNVTSTAASGLSDAAKERTNVAPFGTGEMEEEAVMNWVGWEKGNYLPASLQNLSGEVEVKMYYFNKVKKVFGVGDLYVVLSEGTTSGISSVATETTVSNGAIYNLAGQRVSAPVRGQIYIQNGKKFIQK